MTRIFNKVMGRIWGKLIHIRADIWTMWKAFTFYLSLFYDSQYLGSCSIRIPIRRIWKGVSSMRALPRFILISSFPFPQACCSISSLNPSTSRSVMFKVFTSFQTWRRPPPHGRSLKQNLSSWPNPGPLEFFTESTSQPISDLDSIFKKYQPLSVAP